LKKLWIQIAHLPCAYYATDTWRAYLQLLPPSRHIISKKETYTVEAKNAQIRHYLARFHRRTKCYSKSVDMMEASLTLIIQKINYS
jgi:insertion element IS1 protein InsB